MNLANFGRVSCENKMNKFIAGYKRPLISESYGKVEEASSSSVYKEMPKAAGQAISNRVQVKAFKDVNAMGAFLGKQNDNSWKETGVAGLKSGKYKIDMVRKDGKPSKNFIRITEGIDTIDEEVDRDNIEILKSFSQAIDDQLDAGISGLKNLSSTIAKAKKLNRNQKELFLSEISTYINGLQKARKKIDG